MHTKLHIKLMRGEELQPWQVYKALHAAIQKRGYGRAPWASREAKRSDGKTEQELEPALLKKAEAKSTDEEKTYCQAIDAWPKFKQEISDSRFHYLLLLRCVENAATVLPFLQTKA